MRLREEPCHFLLRAQSIELVLVGKVVRKGVLVLASEERVALLRVVMVVALVFGTTIMLTLFDGEMIDEGWCVVVVDDGVMNCDDDEWYQSHSFTNCFLHFNCHSRRDRWCTSFE